VINVKRWLIVVFVSVCMSLFLFSVSVGFGGPAPEKKTVVKEGVFLIDDFESGSLRTPREWWTFDIYTADVVSNEELGAGDQEIAAEAGKYSLHLEGDATNWYAGGCGTYFAKENQSLVEYNFLVMDVFGNGPGSGTLKIELFDDDNSNWQVEQDPSQGYTPIYDDKFVSDVRVDWVGWERVSIALEDFVDDNPEVGDDVWNPEQAGGSGGLLQVQFICLAGKSEGSVNYNIDNVSLATEEE